MGVVHSPTHGETFRAVRGGGAHLGERRLTVREPRPLEQSLVATGFSLRAASGAPSRPR